MDIATIISLALNVITSVLPLVTGAQNSTTITAISNLIQQLINLLPTIEHWSVTEYNVAKNIIASLENSGNLTADQIQATTDLKAQIDAQWSANLNQFDPDAPGGDPANASAAPASPPVSTATTST